MAASPVPTANGSDLARSAYADGETEQSREGEAWAGLCMGSAVFITHLLELSGARVSLLPSRSLVPSPSLHCTRSLACAPSPTSAQRREKGRAFAAQAVVFLHSASSVVTLGPSQTVAPQPSRVAFRYATPMLGLTAPVRRIAAGRKLIGTVRCSHSA
jgi:hypothetical protein